MVMPGVPRSIPSHSINLSVTKPIQWEPTYHTRNSTNNYPTYPSSRSKYTTEGGDSLGINVILDDRFNLSLSSKAVFPSIDRKWKKERQNGYIQKSKTCADCTSLQSSESLRKRSPNCMCNIRLDPHLHLRYSRSCLYCNGNLEERERTRCQSLSGSSNKGSSSSKGNLLEIRGTKLQSTSSLTRSSLDKEPKTVDAHKTNPQLSISQNEIAETETPGIKTQREKVITKLWRSNESFTEYKCKKDLEAKESQESKKNQENKKNEEFTNGQESKGDQKTYLATRDEFVEPVNVHPPTKTVQLPILDKEQVPPERRNRTKRRSVTGMLYVPPLLGRKAEDGGRFPRDLKAISRSYSAPLPDINDTSTGPHDIQSLEPLKPPRKNRRSLKAVQLTPVLERREDCHADGGNSENNMNCRKGPAHKYVLKDASGSSSKMGAPYEEPTGNKYKLKEHPQCYGVESVQENLATDSGPDQGYSSERSPEEEEDELLVGRKKRRNVRCEQKNKTGVRDTSARELNNSSSEIHIHHVAKYIDSESVFDVSLEKSSRGLGLSVVTCGDLVRVRKLYPLQPASQSQQILLGDVILYANGNPLTGLTTNEALEVLRTLGQHVVLTVFRPPSGLLPSLPGVTSPCLLTIPVDNVTTGGEFNLTISKVNGSLGFTLRKQDESILGHYVRALVKEPAISDGRIRPGDRILTVNGTDLSEFSHKEAVSFLRTCPDTVTLRLYRDPSQTPVSPSSPTEHNAPTFPKKPLLRKEAVDMLTDLAIQRSSPNNSPVRNRRIGSSGSPLHRSKQAKLRQLSLRSASASACMYTGTHDPVSGVQTKPDINVEPPTPSPDKTVERPNFLDLDSSENKRKDKFVFTPETEYSSLPAQGFLQDDSNSSQSTETSATSSDVNFSHNKHNYQSVNLTSAGMPQYSNGPMSLTNSEQDLPGGMFGKKDGKEGLLKWRGSVFQEEEEDLSNGSESTGCNELTVELVRGWSSRLGFSVKPCPKGSYISAIYPDSVAYRDGRLREGDVLLTVNGELVVNKKTEDVIDLMRKVGGKVVVITVEQGGNLPEKNNNS